MSTRPTLLIACLASLLFAAAPAVAQDKDKDKDKPKDAKSTKEQVADLRDKLKDKLVVVPNISSTGKVTIHYALQERKEIADFKFKGFDKCEVYTMRWNDAPITGLEIGAGSRKGGKLEHKLVWTGDFHVKFRMQLLSSPPSAIFCFTLGKKVGVFWGQRLVKLRGFKPLTKKGKLDRNIFKEARTVEIELKREGNTLSVKADGLPTDTKEFTKGELDNIKIGIIAKNARMLITGWSFAGGVDAKKIK